MLKLSELKCLKDCDVPEACFLDPSLDRQIMGTDTPADWAETVGRGAWVTARHHRLISDAATASIAGTGPPVLIVEVPARHGKSTLLSQYLTSWYLGRWPRNQVIMVSATQRLAERWSRRARGIVERYGPDYYGVGVHPIRRAASDWETSEGGGMLAAGVGGDIMGRDGNLVVVDDYLRNAGDALSETVREGQWDWFQSTLLTRMEPGGAIVILATRWHTDDLIGRIVGVNEDEGISLPYRRIKLPAIATESDELGRKPGEALWPERWPLGDGGMAINGFGKRVISLTMRQKDMDPFWWDAIYQQNPRREGLGQWPIEYFDDVMVEKLPASDYGAIVSVDLAEGKSAKGGDYSAIVALKMWDQLAWVQCTAVREPPELTIARAVETCIRERIYHLVIEAQQFGSVVGGVVTRELDKSPLGRTIQVDIVRQVDEKIRRIHSLGGYLSRRQIRIVDDPGGRILLGQLKDFPHAKHDDGPDALEQAIRYLPDAVSGRRNTIASTTLVA